MSSCWHTALAFALVGEDLGFAATDGPSGDQLVELLAASGWNHDTIATHAAAVIAAEQPWPHPVPAELREGCGPAQFHAALTGLRRRLGVLTLETRPPSTRRRLNADEERLMREVPPHHVH